MNTAAKKKGSLAFGVIASMIAFVASCLVSSAAIASSVSDVGLKTRAEVFGRFTPELVERSDENPVNSSRIYDALDGVALECTVAPIKAADLPWARPGAARAAKAIEAGQSSIKVASRDDAAELVWRMFSSRGFLNTTGRSGSDVRKIVGSKAGTYHWDDVLDASGNVAGHGADNAHAAMRHVQVHLENGDIIRIFFP